MWDNYLGFSHSLNNWQIFLLKSCSGPHSRWRLRQTITAQTRCLFGCHPHSDITAGVHIFQQQSWWYLLRSVTYISVSSCICTVWKCFVQKVKKNTKLRRNKKLKNTPHKYHIDGCRKKCSTFVRAAGKSALQRQYCCEGDSQICIVIVWWLHANMQFMIMTTFAFLNPKPDCRVFWFDAMDMYGLGLHTVELSTSS